ncbi:MAG: hypothetical protein ORN57_01910, partial [Alphaproteobacteria bacterium]|nr:hypothetical protein [Alphaproteobacteria bacterium]
MVASPIITTLVDHCPPPSNQATAQTAPANQAITPATIPVVVATMLHHAFDYRAPATPLQAGEIVMVPLGRRKTIGVHMPEWPSPTSVTADKLKTPIRSYGAPPFAYPALTADHRRFLIKLSTYYGGRWAAPLGAVIKMALPELAVFDPAFIAKQLAPALPKTL